MIALDTNVLVRFLVEDDRAQAERARALLKSAVEGSQPLFVSDVVLCELIWVLERSYKFQRQQIRAALELLLRANHLAFASPDRCRRALQAYETGRGGYSDYLIRERAQDFGCEAVATFDAALIAETGFVSP